MVFFLIAVLAGILTVLAPCILPLLPIIIGSSETEGKHISKRSLVVIGSLSVSVIVFTILLKATTLLIDIPQIFWSVFSGTVIVLVGLAIVFPSLWARIPFVQKISTLGNKAISTGYQKKELLRRCAHGTGTWTGFYHLFSDIPIYHLYHRHHSSSRIFGWLCVSLGVHLRPYCLTSTHRIFWWAVGK